MVPLCVYTELGAGLSGVMLCSVRICRVCSLQCMHRGHNMCQIHRLYENWQQIGIISNHVLNFFTCFLLYMSIRPRRISFSFFFPWMRCHFAFLIYVGIVLESDTYLRALFQLYNSLKNWAELSLNEMLMARTHSAFWQFVSIQNAISFCFDTQLTNEVTVTSATSEFQIPKRTLNFNFINQ